MALLHLESVQFLFNESLIGSYGGASRRFLRVLCVSGLRSLATLDKAKPDTGNTRGLNLAAVKHTTVQVSRLPW
jgi:hypothetical protein